MQTMLDLIDSQLTELTAVLKTIDDYKDLRALSTRLSEIEQLITTITETEVREALYSRLNSLKEAVKLSKYALAAKPKESEELSKEYIQGAKTDTGLGLHLVDFLATGVRLRKDYIHTPYNKLILMGAVLSRYLQKMNSGVLLPEWAEHLPVIKKEIDKYNNLPGYQDLKSQYNQCVIAMAAKSERFLPVLQQGLIPITARKQLLEPYYKAVWPTETSKNLFKQLRSVEDLYVKDEVSFEQFCTLIKQKIQFFGFMTSKSLKKVTQDLVTTLDLSLSLYTLAADIQKLKPEAEVNDLAARFFKLKAAIEKQPSFEDIVNERLVKELNTVAETMFKKMSAKSAPEEYPGLILPVRRREMDYFEPWATKLTEKKSEFVKRKETLADLAVGQLMSSMQALKTAYVRGFLSLDEYKGRAHEAIQDAHARLDQHRGWKQLLINLALAVTVIGYIASAIYNRSFYPALPIDTQSKTLLDALDKKVDDLQPTSKAV